jgi:hypothetical protein
MMEAGYYDDEQDARLAPVAAAYRRVSTIDDASATAVHKEDDQDDHNNIQSCPKNKPSRHWFTYPGQRRRLMLDTVGPPSDCVLVPTGGNALQAIPRHIWKEAVLDQDSNNKEHYQWMAVTVPANTQGGDFIYVVRPNNRDMDLDSTTPTMMETQIPPGLWPGHTFLVRFSANHATHTCFPITEATSPAVQVTRAAASTSTSTSSSPLSSSATPIIATTSIPHTIISMDSTATTTTSTTNKNHDLHLFIQQEEEQHDTVRHHEDMKGNSIV